MRLVMRDNNVLKQTDKTMFTLNVCTINTDVIILSERSRVLTARVRSFRIDIERLRLVWAEVFLAWKRTET